MVSGYGRNVTIEGCDIRWTGDTAIALWGKTDELAANGTRGWDGTAGTHPDGTRIARNRAAEHDLARGDLAPLGLVAGVAQHGQEHLVGDELQVLKDALATKFHDDEARVQLNFSLRQRVCVCLDKEYHLRFANLVGDLSAGLRRIRHE